MAGEIRVNFFIYPPCILANINTVNWITDTVIVKLFESLFLVALIGRNHAVDQSF